MEANSALKRKDLLTAVFTGNVNRVEIQEITMPPGVRAPKHSHPCPVVGIIRSGTAVFQIEGDERILLYAGDAFYEPKDKVILHFGNASDQEPMTFTAFYMKEGNEENILIL